MFLIHLCIAIGFIVIGNSTPSPTTSPTYTTKSPTASPSGMTLAPTPSAPFLGVSDFLISSDGRRMDLYWDLPVSWTFPLDSPSSQCRSLFTGPFIDQRLPLLECFIDTLNRKHMYMFWKPQSPWGGYGDLSENNLKINSLIIMRPTGVIQIDTEINTGVDPHFVPYIFNEFYSLPIIAPSNPVSPHVYMTGQRVIGICMDIHLDVVQSTWPGPQPLQYTWAIIGDVILHAKLDGYLKHDKQILHIPFDDLSQSGIATYFLINVTAHSFLGTSHSIQLPVEIWNENRLNDNDKKLFPHVYSFMPHEWTSYTNRSRTYFRILSKFELKSWSSTSTEYKTCLTENGFDIPVSNVDTDLIWVSKGFFGGTDDAKSGSVLDLKRGGEGKAFHPNETPIIFNVTTVSAGDDDSIKISNVTQTYPIDIHSVSSIPIVAVIAGGARQYNGDDDLRGLHAKRSFDPGDSQTKLKYRWGCMFYNHTGTVNGSVIWRLDDCTSIILGIDSDEILIEKKSFVGFKTIYLISVNVTVDDDDETGIDTRYSFAQTVIYLDGSQHSNVEINPNQVFIGVNETSSIRLTSIVSNKASNGQNIRSQELSYFWNIFEINGVHDVNEVLKSWRDIVECFETTLIGMPVDAVNGVSKSDCVKKYPLDHRKQLDFGVTQLNLNSFTDFSLDPHKPNIAIHANVLKQDTMYLFLLTVDSGDIIRGPSRSHAVSVVVTARPPLLKSIIIEIPGALPIGSSGPQNELNSFDNHINIYGIPQSPLLSFPPISSTISALRALSENQPFLYSFYYRNIAISDPAINGMTHHEWILIIEHSPVPWLTEIKLPMGMIEFKICVSYERIKSESCLTSTDPNARGPDEHVSLDVSLDAIIASKKVLISIDKHFTDACVLAEIVRDHFDEAQKISDFVGVIQFLREGMYVFDQIVAIDEWMDSQEMGMDMETAEEAAIESGMQSTCALFVVSGQLQSVLWILFEAEMTCLEAKSLLQHLVYLTKVVRNGDILAEEQSNVLKSSVQAILEACLNDTNVDGEMGTEFENKIEVTDQVNLIEISDEMIAFFTSQNDSTCDPFPNITDNIIIPTSQLLGSRTVQFEPTHLQGIFFDSFRMDTDLSIFSASFNLGESSSNRIHITIPWQNEDAFFIDNSSGNANLSSVDTDSIEINVRLFQSEWTKRCLQEVLISGETNSVQGNATKESGIDSLIVFDNVIIIESSQIISVISPSASSKILKDVQSIVANSDDSLGNVGNQVDTVLDDAGDHRIRIGIDFGSNLESVAFINGNDDESIYISPIEQCGHMCVCVYRGGTILLDIDPRDTYMDNR